MAADRDLTKARLSAPISVSIFSPSYCLDGKEHQINVYPTTQFVYSLHIAASYSTDIFDFIRQIPGLTTGAVRHSLFYSRR